MKLIISFTILSVFYSAFIQADTLMPINSGKALEVEISYLLADKLKVEASLKVTDKKGEDIRLVTAFAEDKQKSIPKVVASIDTKVLSKDKNNNALTQVISIFSIAEIKLNGKDRLKLLEWANSWNGNTLPIRIQIVKNKIVASTNLITSTTAPINELSVLESYLRIVQVWPTIIKSLSQEKLITK